VTIPFGDARALAAALVRVDSRNPTLVPGAPGEGPAATLLAEVLRAWGARVEVADVVPGRPNVVARFGAEPTAGDTPSLMFNGHLDVVGTEGMTHAPFAAEERDGLLYGRGSADMKGGIAAMCAAAARAAADGARGELVVAAVIDEEYESLGTRALLARGVRARAANVGEPTLGRPSVHASTITGGVGWSTYPERCVLRVERRTLPGETAADALAELEAACARVRRRRPAFDATLRLETAQVPSDVRLEAPIARAVVDAARAVTGAPPAIAGLSAWTDAALLNEAGIPAVCYGPGDIALAHAAAEWVPTLEIETATEVLTRLALEWYQPAP
jgi:acetylornithine deacetylase